MIPFPEVSPEIFSVNIFNFTFALRWYALSYIFGFWIALVVIKYFIHRPMLWKGNVVPMTPSQADSLITYLIFGVIIGGRLGYCLFYNLEFYSQNPIDVLKIWSGGMSFHGGFLGVVLAAIIFCRKNGISLWPLADLVAVASPPGIFLGRLANFINAELWGRPTSMPWGIIFPGEMAQNCPGVIGVCARHPSQLYEALLEGLLLFLLLFLLAKYGAFRKSGFLTGLFFFWYGAARFFVEYFRVPDPQFFSNENQYGFALSIGDMGLTMGQSLSVPMLIVGVLLIYFSSKSTRVSLRP